MKEEIKNGNYSILSKELQKQLASSNKSILYIPRRGSSTFILCRDCGYVIKCSHCDVPMVLHRIGGKLLCHHCGNEEKPPSLCPSCKGYRIKYFGAGTQRVEAELEKMFPKIKIFRLDSDTAKKPEEQQQIIDRFHKSKQSILIGTQMIFDKNIKPTGLVGIISLETVLNLPDYRSSERVFRTVNRLEEICKKTLLVQTYSPENFAIQTAVDNSWKKFYNKEIQVRRTFHYPPFSRIIKLSFEHKNVKQAEQEAKILLEKLMQQLKQLAINNKQLAILGPIPAFIPKVAGKYKWQIIIKNKIPASPLSSQGGKDLKNRNKLLRIVPSIWEIEIDPESLL